MQNSLQVKPDDMPHTVSVVFSVTDSVTLLLFCFTWCVNLDSRLSLLLAQNKCLCDSLRRSQAVCLLSGLSSVEKDQMWLCHFCADYIEYVSDDSSKLLHSLLVCCLTGLYC